MNNMNFKVENVSHDPYNPDIDLIKFDVVTALGRVTVHEYINKREDGTKHVERVDSHIRCHEVGALCEVFDMSEKPSLLPAEDWLPLHAIFDEVDTQLEALKL